MKRVQKWLEFVESKLSGHESSPITTPYSSAQGQLHAHITIHLIAHTARRRQAHLHTRTNSSEEELAVLAEFDLVHLHALHANPQSGRARANDNAVCSSVVFPARLHICSMSGHSHGRVKSNTSWNCEPVCIRKKGSYGILLFLEFIYEGAGVHLHVVICKGGNQGGMVMRGTPLQLAGLFLEDLCSWISTTEVQFFSECDLISSQGEGLK